MTISECCQDEKNLGDVESLPDAGDGEVFRRCRVCSRRHFTVTIDPLVIGIRAGDKKGG
jgi:hypothetical protein